MMHAISVLMSTFNESEIEIKMAIESIINQDFNDFEFIIVNDNPKRKDLSELLTQYCDKDSRIKIITNKKNIGLAMSLNKAAEVATSPYLLRMDADDISLPGRLRKQYEVIKTGRYDCICSGFEVIDSQGNKKDRKIRFYNSEDISRNLPFDNIIHHPTIIMTKKIFEDVGGYRDFPCAQDYDLWLRFLARGCVFYMIDEVLLQYRIRENSITSTAKLKQKYTCEYIKLLYMKRLKEGDDKYLYSDYLVFMEKNKANDDIKKEKFIKHNLLLAKANKNIQNKRYIIGYILRLRVFLTSSVYRYGYLKKISMKRLLNRKTESRY